MPSSKVVFYRVLTSRRRNVIACDDDTSITQLQNDVILLIFRIWKIPNTGLHFVGNLILDTTCDFYHNDITTTLFIDIKYGDVAVESIP